VGLELPKTIMVGNRKARKRIGRREKSRHAFSCVSFFWKMQVVNMKIHTHIQADISLCSVHLYIVHSCKYKENPTSHHYFLLLLGNTSSMNITLCLYVIDKLDTWNFSLSLWLMGICRSSEMHKQMIEKIYFVKLTWVYSFLFSAIFLKAVVDCCSSSCCC
jgi:hypothetical protein